MKNKFILPLRIISITTVIALIFGSVVSWNISASNTMSFADSALREDVVLSLTEDSHGECFNVYYGENADDDGLAASSFDERFSLKNSYIQHNFSMSNVTDYWKQNNDYMSTALYGKGQYRDFEMSIEYKGTLNKSGYASGILLFGVTDPTNWVTNEGGGFSVRNYNEGNSYLNGFVDGVYKAQVDPKTDYNKTKHFINTWDYWYKMTVKVQGSEATVSIDAMTSGYEPYSYTYDLGSEYTGGYVGFAAPCQISKYRNFKIVDLGGEVTPPAEKYKNDFKSGEDLVGFDCYYATDAKNGLGLQEGWEPYWELVDGGIRRTANTVGKVSYDTDAYVSSLVYKERQYKNFELTVKTTRQESGGKGYMYPMIIFGQTDPAKHYKQAGGGIACFATAEGALCVSGEGIYQTSKAPTSGYYREGVHTFKISVKYGIATVEMIGASGETLPDPITVMVPEEYTGGYIALVGMANPCGFKNLSIKELLNADVQRITVESITRPADFETPTAVLGDELALPESVSVRCSDGETYDVPVKWSFDNYDRFTRGEYEITGDLESIRVDENRKRILTSGVTALMTVKVTGDKDLSPVKVACVGDSITYGDGPARLDNYPNLLQKALGGKYVIENFGVNGATLMESGDAPYTETDAFVESKAFEPNIVVIMLGTNDSKSQNWNQEQYFETDYLNLIKIYEELPSKPTVYIALSPSVTKSNYGITDEVVTGKIVPRQKKIAEQAGLTYIDINALTRGQTAWFSDGIHPNGEACGYIAKEIADNIMLPEPLRSITLNKTNAYIITGQSETFKVSYQPAVITESKDITWTSSDESIASVDENGKVTGIKAGKATITADCHGKTASVSVEIYAADAEITVPLTNEADMQAFDYYYTDDAANGYTKQFGWQNHWYLSGNGITRTDDTIGQMKWGDWNVASLLYNRQQYHNFDLTVDIHRKDKGEWQYPMIVFGIKDPTKYFNKSQGGVAVFVTAEGGIVVTGQINGETSGWITSKAPPDGSGYRRESVHTLNVKVEYNTVTVTLYGANGEPLPAPLTVELGDTDMDGYIALVGKANPCGFKNFKIKALLNNDLNMIKVEKAAETPSAVEVEVGTLTDDITFPEKVLAKATDGRSYSMPVIWDYDGYNRYKRGEYVLKGYFKDAIFVNERVQVLGNGKYAQITVKVTGDADLIDENTVRFDFNGMSELKKFKNYHSGIYGEPLEEKTAESTWELVDGKLVRLRSENFTTLQTGGWTSEKSKTEIASLVYTERKYKNFELEVDYKRGTCGFWWAMVGFAIEDPTRLITEENGGIATYFEQEGRPIFWSKVRNRSSLASPYTGFGYTSWHHLKLVVNNGVATVSVDGLEPDFSMVIPQEYLDGGYISLMCNANTATYDNLSIKALPDTPSSNLGYDASEYPEIKSIFVEEDVDEGIVFTERSGISPKTGEKPYMFSLSVLAAAMSLGAMLVIGEYRIYKGKNKTEVDL